MAPKIYESPAPQIPVVSRSIYTHLLPPSPGDGNISDAVSAFVDAASGTAISRAQFKHLTLSLGYGMRHHSQVAAKRGDTTLLYSPNSLAWPVVVLGCIAAGLRCTLANSAYTSHELAFQYADSRAKFIFTTEDGLPTVREAFKLLKITQDEGDRRIIILSNCLAWAGGPAAARAAEASQLLQMDSLLGIGTLDREENFDGDRAHETVLLCYSSGTTGKPKGVETTHQNLTTVADSVKCTFPPLTSGVDCMLGILPFYHVFGAVKLLLYPLLCGVTTVIQTRFEPVEFCANVERYKVTLVLVVPPVLVVLARHPAVDTYDMSSLRILFSGAAPLGSALVQQVTDRFIARRQGKGSLAILQGYGLTETSPTTHILPIDDAQRKVGSIGILLSNLQARLVADDEGGKEIESEEGQPGELWVRGPVVMKGYLNNPDATKNAITEDGWFKTGDISIRDKDGYYYIVDRRKELIKYKGFQVPPAELESVLLTHPDIADAAVIGIESVEEATELPRAYVVCAHVDHLKTNSEKNAFAKSIKSWMETKVARHKFLRGGVVVIDIIPKSAAGKILRRELRERAKTELANGELDGRKVKARL